MHKPMCANNCPRPRPETMTSATPARCCRAPARKNARPSAPHPPAIWMRVREGSFAGRAVNPVKAPNAASPRLSLSVVQCRRWTSRNSLRHAGMHEECGLQHSSASYAPGCPRKGPCQRLHTAGLCVCVGGGGGSAVGTGRGVPTSMQLLLAPAGLCKQIHLHAAATLCLEQERAPYEQVGVQDELLPSCAYTLAQMSGPRSSQSGVGFQQTMCQCSHAL
jgi:hypothetical protein